MAPLQVLRQGVFGVRLQGAAVKGGGVGVADLRERVRVRVLRPRAVLEAVADDGDPRRCIERFFDQSLGLACGPFWVVSQVQPQVQCQFGNSQKLNGHAAGGTVRPLHQEFVWRSLGLFKETHHQWPGLRVLRVALITPGHSFRL